MDTNKQIVELEKQISDMRAALQNQDRQLIQYWERIKQLEQENGAIRNQTSGANTIKNYERVMSQINALENNITGLKSLLMAQSSQQSKQPAIQATQSADISQPQQAQTSAQYKPYVATPSTASDATKQATYASTNIQGASPTLKGKPPQQPITVVKPVPQPKPQEPKKKIDFEAKFGGKITNIVGISFVLLGVIFGLSYAYTVIESNIVKAAMAYAVGIIFLGIGEGFNIKSGKSFFSLGMCAGGVGVLFATTAIGYFQLEIFTLIWAFIVCEIVFALALFLSNRYQSQVIAIFAVIGGFAPLFLLHMNMSGAGASVGSVVITAIKVSMGYFFLINLLVLLLAQKHNWLVLKYVSLALSLASFFYLSIEFASDLPVALLSSYIIFTYLLYLAVILIYPLRRTRKLTDHEIALTLINTIVSFIALMVTMPEETLWIAAALFAIFYFLLNFVWIYYVKIDSRTEIVFLAEAVSALLIATLIKLESANFGIAIAVEGFALLFMAIWNKSKSWRNFGTVVSAIGISIFYVFNFEAIFISLFSDYYISIYEQGTFLVQFAVITLGTIALAGAVTYAKREEKDYWKNQQADIIEIFKLVLSVNLWFFIMTCVNTLFKINQITLSNFWSDCIIAFFTLALIFLLYKTPVFKSKMLIIFSAIQGIFVFGLLLFSINTGDTIRRYTPSVGLEIAVILVVLVINSLAVYDLYYILKNSIKNSKDRDNSIPLTISLFSLLLAYLITQNHLLRGVQSAILSLLILLWALGMIVYGFIRNIKNIRLTGLGLSAVATIKIFFFDLSYLDGWQKALSYACFGLIFIVISFSYQFFSSKLLPQETNKKNEDGTDDTLQEGNMQSEIDSSGYSQVATTSDAVADSQPNFQETHDEVEAQTVINTINHEN